MQCGQIIATLSSVEPFLTLKMLYFTDKIVINNIIYKNNTSHSLESLVIFSESLAKVTTHGNCCCEVMAIAVTSQA